MPSAIISKRHYISLISLLPKVYRFTGLQVYIPTSLRFFWSSLLIDSYYCKETYHRFTCLQVYMSLQAFMFYSTFSTFLKQNIGLISFRLQTLFCEYSSPPFHILKVFWSRLIWNLKENIGFEDMENYQFKSKCIEFGRFTELWIYAVNQRK